MRAVACPSCTRRLKPQDPVTPAMACRYICSRCGATGYQRASDGVLVWSASGDGSYESRQARAAFKHDGRAEMQKAGAPALPGLES